ncbi:lipoprotein aminopeptidase LpqL [Mycolicibacterium insubricum]|uniref:Amidohydrolase n=2 Tax=Mycolicibacterium insubricum TaxID=444597 RepID=A0A1X0DHD7_9MYCO|nr:M28 family metallopeptidase [Mycolicibacterium insubricum]MCB0928424.1 M28 family peptidase [Mycobacterium sp.]ORA71788.1 amidohydrolase [Mycolicibacterium insubricum]BBZ65590.1 lipoprotein aminopeptidase LpqL [Mycolicibacterium insubricum]
MGWGLRGRRAGKAGIAVFASVLVGLTAGCGHEAPACPKDPGIEAAEKFGRELQKKIDVDAMFAHLQKLQDIADANHGTRAIGTPGYEASVDYVATTLRDKGFTVDTPEFEVRLSHSEPGTVHAGDADFTARALKYSTGAPAGGLTVPLVAARTGDAARVCADSDLDGLPVTGAALLVERGQCPFAEKAATAVKHGAVAVIVADNVDEPEMTGTLGESTTITVPVVSVSKADGAALRAHPGQVTVKVDARVDTLKVRNVIAQTSTGSTTDVVMAGAHLDSVPEGPGINDNGSGVAAVLETALQLGPAPQVTNAVRFAFWGAEEVGLVGSQRYVQSLDENQLRDIALYLNFDMLASPNPGYFTYDGDQSTAVARGGAVPRVPEGSAGIERLLVGYLDGAGKRAEDTSFDGRSDYDGFTLAGIPAGGLFAGAEEKMTAEQAKAWGGQADQPFDPNYHQKTDTLEHIDRTALGIQGPGVGFAIGRYAQSLGGRDGVPVRDDRTRHVVQPG